MIQRHGWTLLFHDCLIAQLQRLHAAANKARKRHPHDFESNANVKLFAALSRLILEAVPMDPARDDYRQGTTLGSDFRHWRRAKIGRRFRLFFRYDSRSKVIIYAWVNDDETLRARNSRTDPYRVFQKMLESGHPPNDWDDLLRDSKAHWE